MENSRHKHTPTSTYVKLYKDEQGMTINQSLYKSMLSGILYRTANHPKITLYVGVCAHYQSNPKITHLTQVKRIIKYISETSNYGLLYSSDITLFLMVIMMLTWK